MARIIVIPERDQRAKIGEDHIEFRSIKRATRYMKRYGGIMKLVPSLSRTVKLTRTV